MSFEALKICLVADSPVIESAVRVSCPEPNQIVVASIADVVDEQNEVSEAGRRLVVQASESDVVLVNWSMDRAPVVGTLCHRIRKRSDVPVLGLCGAGQEEIIGALSSGVDDVMTLPLYLPMLQAKVTSFRRLIRSVRKTATRKLRKRLERKQEQLVRHAEATVQERISDHARTDQSKRDPAVDDDVRAIARRALEDAVGDVVNGVAETIAHEVAGDRPPNTSDSTTRDDVLHVGALSLDKSSRRFFVDAVEVELTPKEYGLLTYMMDNAGRACSRDEILDAVWGIDFDTGTNMVDVYMHYVRKKLKTHGHPGVIETVRAHGYRLAAPQAANAV